MKNRFTFKKILRGAIILTIALAITVPGIVQSVAKTTFDSNAKMVLNQLDQQNVKDETFDQTTITTKTLADYNLANPNYEDVNVDVIDGESYIVIAGKNKWKGLKACGTKKDMNIVAKDDTKACQKNKQKDKKSK